MSIQQKIIFASKVFLDKIEWKPTPFIFIDKQINGFIYEKKGQKMHLFEKNIQSHIPSTAKLMHAYSKLYKNLIKISKDTYSSESFLKMSGLIPVYLKTKQLLCFVEQQDKCFWIIHIQQDQSKSQVNIYRNNCIYFIEKIFYQENLLKYKCLIVTPNNLSFGHNKLMNQFIVDIVEKTVMHIQDIEQQQKIIQQQHEQIIKQPHSEKNLSYSEEIHSRFLKLKQTEKHVFYQMKKIFPEEKDNTLCRFLIAKQFNLEKAVDCLKEYLSWRQMMKNIKKQKYQDMMQRNYFIYLGNDKIGRPVILNKACKIVPKELGDEELYCMYYLYYFEIFIPTKMEGLVDQVVIIGDLEDLGMKNFKFQLTNRNLNDMLKYGPERQAKMFIVHPNWIASIIWKILKPLLPKRTLHKINVITNNQEIVTTLEQDMDISVIPDYLGGKNKVSQKLK